MKPTYFRLVVVAIFIASLFLPAIDMRISGPGGGSMAGWMCAVVASVMAPKALLVSLGQGIYAEAILVPTSGMVNYLFLAIFILSFWPPLRRTRLVLAALMVPCFIATWVFFASSNTGPLVGHFLWVAACVLVAIPDAFSVIGREKPRTEEVATDRDSASR